MRETLRPGRRIWEIVDYTGTVPFIVGPLTIVAFMRFLPRGKFEKNGTLYERKLSLIEVYTDHGIRILAAGQIRFKEPKQELAELQIARQK